MHVCNFILSRFSEFWIHEPKRKLVESKIKYHKMMCVIYLFVSRQNYRWFFQQSVFIRKIVVAMCSIVPIIGCSSSHRRKQCMKFGYKWSIFDVVQCRLETHDACKGFVIHNMFDQYRLDWVNEWTYDVRTRMIRYYVFLEYFQTASLIYIITVHSCHVTLDVISCFGS